MEKDITVINEMHTNSQYKHDHKIKAKGKQEIKEME